MGGKILVVDDEVSIRDLLKDTFSNAGCMSECCCCAC
jgi:DNA-binding NtrC family response regulator